MADQYELSGSLCEYDNNKSKMGKERYFSLENNLLNCFRKKKEMMENKDPKYSLDIQECKNIRLENIKLEKGKHDNILCIEHKDKTFFLIATRKEDINRWYHGLSRLCNNSEVEPRPRLGTEPTRPRNERTKPPKYPFSSPSLNNFLNHTIENEAQRRPLPAIPEDESNTHRLKGSEANASNIDIHVLNNLPCCVKHHLAQQHPDGKNMVDTNTTYENIHFIRSLEEWREKTENAKRSLQINNESYRYASALGKLQEPSELVCEEQKDLEPVYMNTRPVPIESQPPPPIKRAVPTQPPPLPIRPKIKQNEKGPATAPKPPVKPKPKNRKTSACANIDDSVRKLVRQHGKTVTINIPKHILIDNEIKLSEINNGIWCGGFEHDCPEKPLSDCILFGDQLVTINDQWLDSSKFADNVIQTTRRQEVSLCVKRLPHAQIITVHRDYEQQRLGLECHRGEITNVNPDEIASTQGRLRPEATGISGMNCNWTITHLNSSPIPPNITTEMMEEKLRMAGKTVHLIVQPTDFVKEL